MQKTSHSAGTAISGLSKQLSSHRELWKSAGVRAVMSAFVVFQLSEAQANDGPRTCGNTVSTLNDEKIYDAFDKRNGGADKRLQFRWQGRDHCDEGDCRLEVISKASTAEKVIATINLAGRTATYCVDGLRRIQALSESLKDGCPQSYALNTLTINLVNENGPFARREVTIDYMYSVEANSIPLDRCTSPDIVDGIFRRHVWTVPLEDGSAVCIAETDYPRNRREPVALDAQYVTSVFGATENSVE